MNAIVAILATLAVAATAPAATRTICITNGHLVPVVGEPIPNGDILIEDGRIAAIGVDLDVPPDAEIIDATGLFVYPGFIDAFSTFGLEEIGSIAATRDTRELGRENPELRASWAINPDTVHIATSRLNGTTAALVAPAGGTFPGQAALIKMHGWTLPEMLVADGVAAIITFPTTPKPPGEAAIATAEKPKVDLAAKLIERIAAFLGEAERYLRRREAARRDPSLPPPPYAPKYEALRGVLDGTQPVIITVEKAKDIELALAFAREHKLRLILHGCAQGYRVAAAIRDAGVPVIVDDLYSGPSEYEDGYDGAWTNVAALAREGVTVCFSSGSALTGKDLPTFAARAVAFGMDRDEAIRALTINPARVLGVADRLGSLEVGKDADLFLTTGDPLQITSEVRVMLIGGEVVDLDANWWNELYQKWSRRPPSLP